MMEEEHATVHPITIEESRKIGVKKDVFFRRLLVSNPKTQTQMVNLVIKELNEMIEKKEIELLDHFYPSVVRLAREAPFQQMRDAFSQVMEQVLNKWPKKFSSYRNCRRVSYFIENVDIENIDKNQDEQINKLFQKAFLRHGRVSHFMQLLAWHPRYLEPFQESISCIMLKDGTLPLPWRHYIALMAASEFRCNYIAELHQYYFITNGGDYEWIKGIDYVSPKLFRLHELSSLLAHRPWLITAEHISQLLVRSENFEDSWSVSELVHAIIVLCSYHSVCSIASGLGCADEEDFAIFSDFGEVISSQEMAFAWTYSNNFKHQNHITDSASSCGSLSDLEISTMERDDNLLLKRLTVNSHEGSDTADEDDVFEEEEAATFEICEGNGHSYGINSGNGSIKRKDTLWRFCGGSVLAYSDFNVKSDEYNVLHTEDFSWDEHCFSLVKRYFPGNACQILEDLFNLTGKLTYESYGTQSEPGHIDTTPFRSAIWYYVHRIFGICHDDYDYRDVNIYLNRPTKAFVKKVACTPWKVTKEDFDHFDRTLTPSEKCHVVLIAAEARKQAGLMYGLRAVMQFMR
jgi:sestrin